MSMSLSRYTTWESAASSNRVQARERLNMSRAGSSPSQRKTSYPASAGNGVAWSESTTVRQPGCRARQEASAVSR
jgi:hypothetical protein